MSRPCGQSLESDTPMTEVTPLTPQEKLAISRRALMRVMAPETRVQIELEPGGPESGSLHTSTAGEGSAFSAMSYAIKTWWRHHPAHAVLDVGRPVFDRYAARRPFHVLGIALALGASAVFLRPWRLISLGGLLLAAFKSASTPGVLLSMLTSRPDHSPKKTELL